jgi:type IV secretory pathway VirB6-like protein
LEGKYKLKKQFYDDLDEILARFLSPITALLTEVQNSQCYHKVIDIIITIIIIIIVIIIIIIIIVIIIILFFIIITITVNIIILLLASL